MKNFNPRLIFSQIVAMQCFHYLLLGFFFQINHVLYGQSITIDRMFTDKYLTVFHARGWPDVLAVFLSYAAVGYVGCSRTMIIFVFVTIPFCLVAVSVSEVGDGWNGRAPCCRTVDRLVDFLTFGK
jgi:Integral membrane protein S linking to the trans Golgi network